MQSRFFLNVVIRQCSPILQLFASEDQSLLVRGNSFLILDFRFHIINRIGGFHFQRDGFSSQGFHENLHSSS